MVMMMMMMMMMKLRPLRSAVECPRHLEKPFAHGIWSVGRKFNVHSLINKKTFAHGLGQIPEINFPKQSNLHENIFEEFSLLKTCSQLDEKSPADRPSSY